PARVELLDAVARHIRNVDVPAPVGRHADRDEELSVARADAPPGGEERPARVELLDAGVPRIRDADVPAPVSRHAGLVPGGGDLPAARARAPPGGQERPARVELLDAAVPRIRDVDVPAPVSRHAGGAAENGVVDELAELPVARASAPPTGEQGAGGQRCGCGR